MHASRAFMAGVTGGAVMSLLMFVGRQTLGMPANLEMMLGTMINIPPGPTAWMVGFIMHLIISGLIALAYAAGFEYVTHRAGWVVGAAFSTLHILIGGLFMGMVPAIHPLIPQVLPAPGAFMSEIPLGPLAFVILHVIYGAVVGAMYKPVAHARPLQTREA